MSNYRSPGVYIEERQAGSRPIEGVGTAIAAFVGVTADGPFNVPTKVTNWGQYVRTFGGFVEDAFLPLSVYSYFENGGGSCYVVRLPGASSNGNGGPKARTELNSAARDGLPVYEIEARDEGASGDEISIEVVHGNGQAALPAPADGEAPAEGGDAQPPQDGADSFSLIVRKGDVTETFSDVTIKRGKRSVATVVNEESALVRIQELPGAPLPDRLPSAGQLALAGGAGLPVPLTPTDFIGDAASRRGLGALEAIDDITMVAVPDLMAGYQQGTIDRDGIKAVQQALVAHCERMKDRMAILDMPFGLSPQEASDWRANEASIDSKYAALYWPSLYIMDPGTSRTVLLPPSGPMAGIWSRNDASRGVHKAPANEPVFGALDIEVNITRHEHDDLNPIGVNVLRAFPGAGIRVWGARTMAQDASWRYINVRRLFNFVESSILNGTQWVVFEPNDLDLWQRIKRTISAFLLRQWRDGALFGATPEEAFYVKCDSETNPPEVIEAGQVVIEIGIAPVKPAEFVVFRIAQLPSGGGEVS